jgi:HPt (histidine-containing phosphotransfer) domain-containing protein
VKIARRRLGERPGLYEQVLDEVVGPLREHESIVAQALARGDRVAAARHAHDLKGLARTIGAGALADAAQKLESHLDGDADPARLRALRAEVAQRVAACLDALAPVGDDGPTTPAR